MTANLDTALTDLAAEWLGRKLQVLEQLHDLCRRQSELIELEKMDDLLSVLNAKQSLVQALEAIERQFAPFQNQVPEQRVWRSPEHRSACRQTADRCRQRLGEILQIEKHCESELIQQREKTAARLQTAGSAKQACQAYGRQNAPGVPAAAKKLDLYSS